MEILGGILVGLVVLFVIYRAIKKENSGGNPPIGGGGGGPDNPTNPKSRRKSRK